MTLRPLSSSTVKGAHFTIPTPGRSTGETLPARVGLQRRSRVTPIGNTSSYGDKYILPHVQCLMKLSLLQNLKRKSLVIFVKHNLPFVKDLDLKRGRLQIIPLVLCLSSQFTSRSSLPIAAKYVQTQAATSFWTNMQECHWLISICTLNLRIGIINIVFWFQAM